MIVRNDYLTNRFGPPSGSDLDGVQYGVTNVFLEVGEVGTNIEEPFFIDDIYHRLVTSVAVRLEKGITPTGAAMRLFAMDVDKVPSTVNSGTTIFWHGMLAGDQYNDGAPRIWNTPGISLLSNNLVRITQGKRVLMTPEQKLHLSLDSDFAALAFALEIRYLRGNQDQLVSRF